MQGSRASQRARAGSRRAGTRRRRLRLESVPNAIDMADCVAGNILGRGVDYVPKPWFWSDQYDVKLQITGLSTGYDRIVTRDGGAAECEG